jgi:hypothetical protein
MINVAETLANAAGHQRSTLKLEAPGPGDAANLPLEEAGIDAESVTPSLLSCAEEFMACVGRLPLAVVQAASFAKQTRMNLDGMLKWYKSERKIEVGPHSYMTYVEHNHSPAMTGNSVGE